MYIIILINNISLISAQTWYFGKGAGIHFKGKDISIAKGSPIDTNEGCSIINFENGNVIFYTDGKTVWDRNHKPLINGKNLLGNSSATQSALIIPIPNTNCSKYFIFTVDSAEHNLENGFRYNVVDISNGGEVVIKNKLLYKPVTEKLTAISDKKGGYWVLTHDFDKDLNKNKKVGNQFICYHINSKNINLNNPIVSKTGSYHVRTTIYKFNQYQNAQGQMKFSPDGTKVALAVHKKNFIEIFDFKNGVVSNPKKYQFDKKTGYVYGVEFSTNSKYLYFTHLNYGNKFLRRINLNKLSGTYPKTLKFNVNYPADGYEEVKNIFKTYIDYSLGALQLGPNKNIYVANRASSIPHQKISVILNPDSELATFNHNTVIVSNDKSYGSLMGLPTLINDGTCKCIDSNNDGICNEKDLISKVKYDKIITQDVVLKLNEYAKTILFNTAEYTFKDGVTNQLDSVVKIMKKYKFANFSIEGHTDSNGTDADNFILSNNRAKAVKKYLILNGIDSMRIITKGFGEKNPIDTNKTTKGRENNRRVEIKIINN